MDVVFVVLHYKTFQDTVDCIESIEKKIDTDSYHIIVVDNASGNGSGEKLQDNYREAENITVLINESNLGFAKGLNKGIVYAREKWNIRYVVAINNDTLLVSRDFVKTLDEKYEQYGFSVVGHMMVTGDGNCNVNPIRNTIRSVSEVEESIRKYRRIIKLCNLHLYKIYKVLKRFKRTSKAPLVCIQDQVNYKLHGACWIFSKLYFEIFDGLDESTFLYGEEDILYLHVISNSLKTLYTPDIVIYHKEDSSTDETLPDNMQKVRFVSENCINSLNCYLELLKKYNVK